MLKENNKILIIGLVWPEPTATAAGSRMIQLIEFFMQYGYQVSFASAAVKSDLSFDLSKLDVSCIDIELNSDSFDQKLKQLDPGLVVFDRFLSEEQYGWRVQEVCPEALRILDSEDLHFLRKSRELALINGVKHWRDFIQNDITTREIASIFRCDISLIISEFEYRLLEEEFKVDPNLLFHIPFMLDIPKDEVLDALPGFDQRQHFMTIGNFKHQPNLDAVKYLQSTIWPLIKKSLPETELHVFGAYLPQSIRQLHNPDSGFIVKGWIENKKEAFTKSRICLAPLRFGAGQKGKLLDAMYYGTPSITSSFGIEGMAESVNWNGYVEDKAETFALKAVMLYQDKTLWENAQNKGYKILGKQFDKNFFGPQFNERLKTVRNKLRLHRRSNFIGSMLSHHQHQSLKYLSKWIEAKNLLNDKIIE